MRTGPIGGAPLGTHAKRGGAPLDPARRTGARRDTESRPGTACEALATVDDFHAPPQPGDMGAALLAPVQEAPGVDTFAWGESGGSAPYRHRPP